ncbi:MAG TPA: hypothetical protein VEA16_12440, partial [Vicinamibacterales bacterium]|nr:hypothetical protein [Vicinamibacterales bacterium]
LAPSDLDKELRYFDGRMLTIRDLLWDRVLIHAVHHRGQLVVLCRLSGGLAPGVAGPNREESVALRARLAAEKQAAATV